MAKAKTPASKNAGDIEITTFANAVRYLLDRTNFERKPDARLADEEFKLERMQALLEAVGNPHTAFDTVHVAGTVGKGSTVRMIASMLQECGYAVGEFTSPHLIDMRERIRISGKKISQSDFTALVQEIEQDIADIDFEPTFFELITLLAFSYFAAQAVDIAIIETGLGGRLDCTNVITPKVSVITTIDRDHEHILGDTLEKIASEKAGIIKPGIPAITHEQPEVVIEVLKAHAEKVGAQLRVIGDNVEFTYRFGGSASRNPHAQICVESDNYSFEHISAPLPGEFQAFNCALALVTIDVLANDGYRLSEMKMHVGLAASEIAGRMELICEDPPILVDGAHNPIALQALMRNVGAHVQLDSMICIFGCCDDKDIPAMLKEVAKGGDKVIFTRARGTPRATDPELLAELFLEHTGRTAQVAANITDALDLAKRAANRGDLICVTGSFYLAGETKRLIRDLERKRKG